MTSRQTTQLSLLTIVLAFASCATRPGVRELSGTYVHQPSGGVIVFRTNGEFYYSFTESTTTLPRNSGHYRFEEPTDSVPQLSVRSAHNGLFKIRVTQSGDQVFLTHPTIFTGEQVYQKQ